MREVFSTGQVATLCHVAPRTVSKWFDTGRLRGYRIPGSQDRRVPRKHLLAFLRAHHLDDALQRIVGVAPWVILAGLPADTLLGPLTRLLQGKAELRTTDSLFQLGLWAGDLPDAVAISASLGTSEALLAAGRLAADGARVAVILPEDVSSVLPPAGVRLLQHPVAPEAIASALLDDTNGRA